MGVGDRICVGVEEKMGKNKPIARGSWWVTGKWRVEGVSVLGFWV